MKINRLILLICLVFCFLIPIGCTDSNPIPDDVNYIVHYDMQFFYVVDYQLENGVFTTNDYYTQSYNGTATLQYIHRNSLLIITGDMYSITKLIKGQ